MPGGSLTIEQILTALAEMPTRLAELTVGLTEAQLHAAPSPGEWSANEVLAHLRACADVWGNCIVTIINQDRPTIRAVNPRTWIKGTNYLEQVSADIAGLCSAAYRSIGGIGTVKARSLVAFRNSNRGRKATRTDRAHLCRAASSP